MSDRSETFETVSMAVKRSEREAWAKRPATQVGAAVPGPFDWAANGLSSGTVERWLRAFRFRAGLR